MQWNIILFLAFALVIAAFAVTNIDAVTVNYLFGEASVPLILVIIGFTLAGAIMVALFNVASQIKNRRTIKNLQHEVAYLKEQVAEYERQYCSDTSIQYVDSAEEAVSVSEQESDAEDHLEKNRKTEGDSTT